MIECGDKCSLGCSDLWDKLGSPCQGCEQGQAHHEQEYALVLIWRNTGMMVVDPGMNFHCVKNVVMQ